MGAEKYTRCYHHGYTIPSGRFEKCLKEASVKMVGSKHFQRKSDSELKCCDKHIDAAYGHLMTAGYGVIEVFDLLET